MLLSFYLITWKNGRQNRVWLHSIDEYPTDWIHLKLILEEVMSTVYLMHGRKEATVTMEKHMPGHAAILMDGYSLRKIPTQRQYEAILDLIYHPNKGILQQITVKRAQFGMVPYHIRQDYWEIERGIKYRGPPLIPRQQRGPMDPIGMLMEPVSTRYADYSPTSHPNYSIVMKTHKGNYGQKPRNLYAPRQNRHTYQ